MNTCCFCFLSLYLDGPLAIILAILGTYALFPSSFAKKFLFFQHYDSATETFEKSWEDLYFLLFWVITFTFLRATVMTYVLMPMARRVGASTERTVQRFAEQGWSCIYYSCSWVLGMVRLFFSFIFLNLFVYMDPG